MTESTKMLEERAIKYFRQFEPESEPYYLAYSGGKDSDVIKSLAKLADVKNEAVHNLTSVDAPETVNYIQSQKDVRIDMYEKSMWRLIEEKLFPPTRIARYCCSELKERGGKGRLVATGVRWAESGKRAESADLIKIIGKSKTTIKEAEKSGIDYRVTRQGGVVLNNDNSESRKFVEMCYTNRKTMLNPIIDWEDGNVWEFLNYYGIESNPLYQCGFNRIGCIGCPNASKHRYVEFERYPKYRENYVKAFDRMLLRRKEKGLEILPTWYNGEAVMRWWLEEDSMQLTFDDINE